MQVYDDMVINHRGNFEDFLYALRTYESGIDKDKFEWYKDNFYTPIIYYPLVTKSGRVIRNFNTGQIEYRNITIKEYFENLGVLDLFDPSNQNSLINMQYKVINPLGFVGYQVGEGILISTGYYRPSKRIKYIEGKFIEYERYYWGSIGVDNWKFDNKEVVYEILGTEKTIIGTDVNCWEGSFTGKDNIYSLHDLMIPEKQEKVIRQIIKFNYDLVQKLLEGTEFLRIFLSPTAKILTKDGVSYTTSGVLAAAHLVGAWDTVDCLLKGIKACDEFGTKIEEYLKKFSHYCVSL